MNKFIGLKVITETGEEGIIEASFGTKGKYKIRFSNGIKPETTGKIILRFKKYIFDPQKRMIQ